MAFIFNQRCLGLDPKTFFIIAYKRRTRQVNLKPDPRTLKLPYSYYSSPPKIKNPDYKSNLDKWFKVLPLFQSSDRIFLAQSLKMQSKGNRAVKDYKEAAQYLSNNDQNTVGLRMSEMRVPYICLDIDLDFVGYRILDLFYGKFKDEINFEAVFGKPIIVQTQTPGHLHLYYKCPNKLPIKFKNQHSSFPAVTRLGFRAEYILKLSTFAGATRNLIRAPESLQEISFLPKCLFPYNHKRHHTFIDNLTGIKNQGANRPQPSFVPKGSRHKTLYAWVNHDNFTLEEVKTMFYTTFSNIEDKLKFESYTNIMFKNTSSESDKKPVTRRRQSWNLFDLINFNGESVAKEPSGYSSPFYIDNAALTQEKGTPEKETQEQDDTSDFDLNTMLNIQERDEPAVEAEVELEEASGVPQVEASVETPDETPFQRSSLRLRPQDKTPQYTYHQLQKMRLIPSSHDLTILHELGFSPDRIYDSIVNYQTPKEIILFVAGVENRLDLFLEDKAWLGHHLEYVVLDVLKNRNSFQIIYLTQDKDPTWFLFDGLSWVPASNKQILDCLYRALVEFNLGGLERTLNDSQALRALSVLAERPFWPTPFSGITFKNGTLTIDTENHPILLPHNPDHFIRKKIMINYNPNAWLTPIECKFIQDCCASQTRLIHVFRLMIYLIFVQGRHQLGFFLYGSAGGTKTTLMNYLKGLDPKIQSTIDPKSLANNKFQVGDLVADKQLLCVADVSPGTLGKSTIEFLKILLGRDPLVAEKKFDLAWNFISNALLLIVSNFSPDKIPAFKDHAVSQRIVYFPTPALLEEYRVSKIEDLLLRNPEGLINWALNIPLELVSKTIRATLINEALNPTLSEIDHFIQSHVIKSPNNFVPYREILKAYTEFSRKQKPQEKIQEALEDDEERDNSQQTVPTEPENLFKTIGQKREFLARFKDRIYKFNQHKIVTDRKGKIRTRGYLNLDLVPDTSLAAPEVRLKRGSSLDNLLDKSPFEYPGIAITDPKTQQLTQSKMSELSLQSYSEKTAFLVAKQNFKSLLQIAPPTPSINSHLITNSDFSGSTLEETLQWDTSQLKSWSPDLDPCLPVSNKSLDRFNLPKSALPEGRTIEEELEDSLDDFNDEDQNQVSQPEKEIEQEKVEEQQQEVVQESEDEFEDSFESTEDYMEKIIKKGGQSQKDLESTSKQEPGKESLETSQNISPKTSGNGRRKRSRKKTTEDSDDEGEAPEDLKETVINSIALPSNWENMHENDLFNHCLKNAFQNSKENRADLVKKTFYKVKPLFKENLTVLKTCLEEKSLKQYKTFTKSYASAGSLETAVNEFRFFPQLVLFDFLNLLNKFYRKSLLNAFDQVRAIKKPRTYNFFGRSLPGSKDLEKPKIQFIELNKTKFSKEKADQLSQNWDGGSLFPMAYDLGAKSYARLMGIPRSTCSTYKHDIKSIILENISENCGLNFIELDLKSCHTVIYKSLAQNIGIKLGAEVPDPTILWPTLTKEFQKAKTTVSFSNSNFGKMILNWSEDQIKIILKAQWYKGLNAGDVFKSIDIVRNARNSLGIPNKEQMLSDISFEKNRDGDFDLEGLAGDLEKVIKQIIYFADLHKFNDAVLNHEEIFLPTQVASFWTSTLSKKQESFIKQAKKGSGFQDQQQKKPRGKTGMSRIFSACEIILVMMAFIVLEDFQDLMPVAYEADGLLIAGYIKDPSLTLAKINARFTILSKRFIEGNHFLEFKQIFGAY